MKSATNKCLYSEKVRSMSHKPKKLVEECREHNNTELDLLDKQIVSLIDVPGLCKLTTPLMQSWHYSLVMESGGFGATLVLLLEFWWLCSYLIIVLKCMWMLPKRLLLEYTFQNILPPLLLINTSCSTCPLHTSQKLEKGNVGG